jgi:hypothetical protein
MSISSQPNSEIPIRLSSYMPSHVTMKRGDLLSILDEALALAEEVELECFATSQSNKSSAANQ